MAIESPALESPHAPAAARRRIPVPLFVVLALSGIALALLLPLDAPVSWWWLLPFLGAGFIGWHYSVPDADGADRGIIPIVAALCAIGILTVARLDSNLGGHQALNMLVGLAIVIAGRRLFSNYRRLAGVMYPWVVVSLLLFVLLRYFGSEVNGARLWFRIGPFTAQPVEAIKLFMVFFMAAYLQRNGAALAALRPFAFVRDWRQVVPLLLVWSLSIASLALQRDFGMACLFLGIFLVMLYVGSRRIDLVVIAAVVFVVGGWFVAQNFPYVHARIELWRDPWSDPLGRGYQAEQAYFSLASGGLLGTGYHLGHPGFIPDAVTDYPFAAIAEEFGLLGGLAVLGLYGALVLRGLRIAFVARDKFTSLLAAGFSATLGIQVAIIVGGVIGLLPLTGITLPFISYGGSSVVANLIMLYLLWMFSAQEQAAQQPSTNP